MVRPGPREDPPVSNELSLTYGDPCLECGISTTLAPEEAIAVVLDLPDSFSEVLEGSSGDERHPDLTWPVSAYVCHVADNLRIWAERLAGVANGAPQEVGTFDERLLAVARNYDRVPLEAGLWSLRRSVAWHEAVRLAVTADVLLLHPERGELDLADVMRGNAHDSLHHRWDIERSLRYGGGG
jgi:hypothetical protein